MISVDVLVERKEIIQEVIDRLLSNPNYKEELIKFNSKYSVNLQVRRTIKPNQK